MLQLIESLPAGQYTVIVSSFEPRMSSDYLLRVESSTQFDVNSIPSEGSGMFSKNIKDIWYVNLGDLPNTVLIACRL